MSTVLVPPLPAGMSALQRYTFRCPWWCYPVLTAQLDILFITGSLWRMTVIGAGMSVAKQCIKYDVTWAHCLVMAMKAFPIALIDWIPMAISWRPTPIQAILGLVPLESRILVLPRKRTRSSSTPTNCLLPPSVPFGCPAYCLWGSKQPQDHVALGLLATLWHVGFLACLEASIPIAVWYGVKLQ